MGDYKAAEKSFTPTSPPKAVDVLAAIFEKHKKRSDVIPPRPFDAAYWWMDHQEPAKEDTERVESVTDKNGHVSWRTPYIDRIANTLRTFLILNPVQQAFVIEQIHQGYPWRGDVIAFYKMVITETDRFRVDPETYKQIGRAALNDALSNN